MKTFRFICLMCAVTFIMVAATTTRTNAGDGDKKPAYRVIGAEEAKTMLSFDTTVVLLDVRTREEFTSTKGHLKNALLIPVQELSKRIHELQPYKKRHILVYCCQCPRSAEASEILIKRGFTVTKMDGGIDTWSEAGYPVIVEKDAKTAAASCSTFNVKPVKNKK